LSLGIILTFQILIVVFCFTVTEFKRYEKAVWTQNLLVWVLHVF